jgi:acyl-CoA thioesterase II
MEYARSSIGSPLVGDLSIDTAVERHGDRYQGTLSDDWEIWGPNGGYVASLALRAAAAESSFVRPASISCHFLRGAKFGPVDLDVVRLRQARQAESFRVGMMQDDRLLLEALVWMVSDVEGLEHDHARMPDVPGPAELQAIEELSDDPRSNRYSFFTNLDERPTSWIDDWDHRQAAEPRVMTWFRFRPVATFEDPAVDACRSLILMDSMEWPAAVRAHTGRLPWVAPSLDLSVRFHGVRPDSEWLFSDTTATVAADGLIGGAASVWSAAGDLLASGGEQMLCRPVQPPTP